MKKFLLGIWIAGLLLAGACSDDGTDTVIIDSRDNSPLNLQFEVSGSDLEEGNPAITVNVLFSRLLEDNLDLQIEIESNNAVAGEDYTVSPAPVNNIITLSATEGALRTSFTVTPISDNDDAEELVNFRIKREDGDNFQLGARTFFSLRIVEKKLESPVTDCTPGQNASTFEIVTWNLEQFPLTAFTTDKVVDMIESMDVDIIAVQEIDNTAEFLRLGQLLEGWAAVYEDVRGGIELGYLYKVSEISSFSTLEALFPNQSTPFPRELVVAEATHVNGLTVKLVNLHLKCCDNGIDRRRQASTIMKDYFDQNEAGSNLVVLGDYNEDLLNTGSDGDSAFKNFMDDTENYAFADMDIQNGPREEWSYPSFPSHIDHILISNELFDNLSFSKTLVLQNCTSRYSQDVSDHRPVMITLLPEQP